MRCRLALLAACLTLVATACLAPAPRLRVQNGFLPDSVLQQINANCRIWRPAAPALLAMMNAASRAGVALNPESCYRSYGNQVAVRADWCRRGSCRYAAVPRTSVHGWGKAVDFAGGTGQLTFSSPGYAWLTANARRYCFMHPQWAQPYGSSPEPWHWEWTC